MSQYKILIVVFLSFSINSLAQIDSNLALTFDFNEQEIKEKDNKVIPKHEGVTLTADRFGNEKSAVYIHGNVSSYLNLSTSKLVKPEIGTISLWVNLDRRVYSGKGYDNNPIIYTKNGQLFDFNVAYAITFDSYSKKIIATSARDSLKEAIVSSIDTFTFANWHHLVITFNEKYFSFFINGKLQNKVRKDFNTVYLISDSVMIGHTASLKNERYSQGVFDDIQFFHKTLSEKEIQELYEAPNPNRVKQFLLDSIKYVIIILIFIIILIILYYRNKRKLKQQKAQFELNNRINELEIKVIKNQMNPHFVSNCLAAIQELIYAENYKKAAQYIAKFSFFMRQVLNYSDKTYISLEEELTLIKLNIELEELRFKGAFEFKITIDEHIDLDKILIPSLITQPFIENAIWHGLLPLNDNRTPCLTIKISEVNNCFFINIEDNGVGRDKFKFNENSKGTKLVMDKIDSINRLLQGNDYKLEIIDLFDSSNIPCGTRVSIQLKNSIE